MKKFIYDIKEEPRGRRYAQLLDYASRCCDMFLLVARDSMGLDSSGQSIISQLKEQDCEVMTTSEWPGTKLLQGTARVYRCRLTPKSLEILKQVDGLYTWTQPRFPEDLCFLRSDGSPWLVSIAHEKDGHFELSADEHAELVESLTWLR